MAERFDAVIVPGGGLLENGELPPWVRKRLEAAASAAQGAYIITLSAGTPHKAPPRDESGMPVLECVAEARYLYSLGYPRDRVLIENASYDTIGNAYFCRVIHTDPAGLDRLLVITSEFHAPRTEAAFSWIFSLPPLARSYELAFRSVPDAGMSDEARAARVTKEAQSLVSLSELAARHQTLASVHNWLFNHHEAYCVPDRRRQVVNDELLLKTY